MSGSINLPRLEQDVDVDTTAMQRAAAFAMSLARSFRNMGDGAEEGSGQAGNALDDLTQILIQNTSELLSNSQASSTQRRFLEEINDSLREVSESIRDYTRRLREIPDTITTQIQPDPEESEFASVEELIRRLTRDRRLEINLDVDQNPAIQELMNYVDQQHDIDIDIDVNDAGETIVILRRIREEVDSIGNGPPRVVRVRVDDGGSTDDFGRRLRGLSVPGGPMFGLIAAAGAAAAALIPIGAVGTAGVLGFASAATSVVPGVGALFLGVKGNMDQLNEALEKSKGNINALPAAMQPAARALDSLKKAHQDFLKATQEASLGLVAQGANLLTSLLPKLVPLFDAFAKVASNALSSLTGWTKTPEFQSFMDFFTKTGSKIFGDFLKILGNLGRGFLGIMQAFAPTAESMSSSLVTLTDRFAKWGTTLSQNKSFQSFMEYVKQNTPAVLSLFSSLWTILKNLIIALAPFGAGTLEGITTFLERVADIDIDTLRDLGPILFGIGAATALLGPAVKILGTLGTALKGVFAAGSVVGAIGAGPVLAIGAIVGALVLLYTQSQTVRDKVAEVWGVIKDEFSKARDRIEPLLKSVKDAWDEFLAAIERAEPLINALMPIVKTAVAGIIQTVSGLIEGALKIVRGVIQIFSGLLDFFNGLFTGDWEQVWNGIKKIFEGMLSILDGIWTAIWASLKATFNNFWTYAQTVASVGWEMLKNIFKGAGDKLKEFWDNLPGWIEAGWNRVSEFFGQMGGWVLEKLGDLGSKLIEWVSTAWDAVTGWLAENGPKLLLFFSDLGPRILIVLGSLALLLQKWIWEGIAWAGEWIVSTALPTMWNWFTGLGSKLMEAAGSLKDSLWNWLTDAFSNAQTTVSGWIEAMVTWFSELPGRIWNAIITLKDKVIQWATEVGFAAYNWITQKFNELVTWLTGLPDRARAAISSFVQKAQEWAVSSGTAAYSWLTQKFNELVTWLSAVPGRIMTFLSSLPGRLHAWALDAGQRAYNALSEKWNSLVTFASGVPGRVWTAVSSLPGKMWDIATQAGGRMWSAMSTKFNEVVTLASGIPGRIARAVGDLSSTLWSAGWDVVRGLANGITGAADSLIRGAADYVTSKIPSWIKSGLGILSPSRVMIPIGEYTSEGVAVGITRGADKFIAPALDMTKGLMVDSMEGLQTQASRFEVVGTDIGNSVATGIQSSQGRVKAAINILMDLLSSMNADAAINVSAATDLDALTRNRGEYNVSTSSQLLRQQTNALNALAASDARSSRTAPNITMNNYNPVRERSSQTAARNIARIAQLSLMEEA